MVFKNGDCVPFYRFLIEYSKEFNCEPKDIRFDFKYRNGCTEYNMNPLDFGDGFDRVKSRYDGRGFWMMNMINIVMTEPPIIEKDGLTFRAYPNKIKK